MDPVRQTKLRRWNLLRQLDRWLETPLLVLSFVWLSMLIAELCGVDNPVLSDASTAIWILFVVDFGMRMLVAPRPLLYLRRNFLTALALALPALRLLRISPALRAFSRVPGSRLVRIVTSVNRARGSVAAFFEKSRLGYVATLTLVITFVGAGGMYAFEAPVAGDQLPTFGAALWWTAMLLTSIGSEYWPHTGEGRILCLLLSLYGFSVFGYLTAALATHLVGREAERPDGELAGANEIHGVMAELKALRAEIQSLRREVQPEG